MLITIFKIMEFKYSKSEFQLFKHNFSYFTRILLSSTGVNAFSKGEIQYFEYRYNLIHQVKEIKFHSLKNLLKKIKKDLLLIYFQVWRHKCKFFTFFMWRLWWTFWVIFFAMDVDENIVSLILIIDKNTYEIYMNRI